MSSTPREIGTLIVVILKARNLPNKRHIGKQDPYCSISLNGEKRRTKAIRRGGQHPEWDEEIRFTLYEDTESEPAPFHGDGTPPPPPPKKDDKEPLRIKGGKSMGIACYAEDLREPDFIGDTKVDLTEVLTKGETDEWFTLMNKDKYSGEVYLELTFWSNEPVPIKKATPKPKPKKSYGGPGSFVPSEESPSSSNGVDSHSITSRTSSISVLSEDPRRDMIPSSLRASNSHAKLDLYVPPYETSRSHQQVPSVDSVTNDFGELGIQSGHRRTSYPPAQSSYQSRLSSSIDFIEPQAYSQQSYGYDQSSYSDSASSYSYERPTTPTGPYQRNSVSMNSLAQYQPPYESSVAYPVQTRRPRYSIPTSSSGFIPIPTPTPSGFVPLNSHPSQLSGFAPPPAPQPAPLGYGPLPSHTPPAPTPAPVGYGPPAHVPIPSSSFAHVPQPQPTPTPSTYPPSLRTSVSYQSLPRSLPPSQSTYSYQLYGAPPVVPNPPEQPVPPPPPPPAAPPHNALVQHQPQSFIPPPPPSVSPHLQSSPPEQGHSHVTPSPPYVPPPPPLNENPFPVNGQSSRPLPQPLPQQHNRRQSSLPIPPSGSAGSYSPTGSSGFGYSYGTVPPPPPLTSSQSNTQYPPPSQPAVPGPPPPLQSVNRMPSSSFYINSQPPMPGPPPALATPAPQFNSNSSGHISLPPPPVGYPPQPHQQQSAYQALPPPPPPPSLPQQNQHEALIAFPSANTGQAIYPGPLPRPPSQYFPSNQSVHSYPASITEGGWQ